MGWLTDFKRVASDPFGTDAKARDVKKANAALQAANDEFGASLGKVSYDVTPDMVNQYMSPDVTFRQNAATQGLAQIYGNKGALRSGAAQAGIMDANANIAAQAWNDAFGRASGVLGQNNNVALQAAQSTLASKQGQAANSAALAMQQNGWLSNTANALGGIGQGVGSVMKIFGQGA